MKNLIIFGVFLITTVVVGIYAVKKQKETQETQSTVTIDVMEPTTSLSH